MSETMASQAPLRAWRSSDLCWNVQSRDRYPLGGPVEVAFFLENHGDRSLRVLPWATPLEGLFGDFLRIELDGRAIPYRGPMVKRGDPASGDYLYLPARGERGSQLDLSRAYELDRPGEVRLRVECRLADCVLDDAVTPRPREAHRPCPVHPADVRFRIEPG